MTLLGVHLTLLIGPTVPVPAPALIVDALDELTVSQGDEGAAGFQMRLQTGRSGLLAAMDFPLLQSPVLKPFNRVIVVVTFTGQPHVLFDGLITNIELQPGDTPGTSAMTITGEDITIAMDKKQNISNHPAQNDLIVVNKIIANYAQYGLIPKSQAPRSMEAPNPNDYVPVIRGTDLHQLHVMAKRHGFVFYVEPGPLPGANVAYWGPPNRVGVPQRALTVNMGSASNVQSVSIRKDSLAPKTFSARIQDRRSNQQAEVRSTPVGRQPPLASRPEILSDEAFHELIDELITSPEQGQALAQAKTEASTDNVVTLTGSLDATRYGNLLKTRRLVGVRGAGFTNDGFYYVKSVEHRISRGAYQQQFTLTREGTGSTTASVIP